MTEKEYKRYGGKYGITTIEKHFKGWNNALIAAGLQPNVSIDDLISAHAESFAKAMLAIKITDLDLFWKNLAKWTSDEFRKAIKAFESKGQVKAFQKLAA